jgi:hypothetical protein
VAAVAVIQLAAVYRVVTVVLAVVSVATIKMPTIQVAAWAIR